MVQDRRSAARALVSGHTVLRGVTRIGVWQVDLPLDGCTDSHNVHHFCIVSGPRQGQHKHGGAAPDDYSHSSLPAAASLHTPPQSASAQANRDPKRGCSSRAVKLLSGGVRGAWSISPGHLISRGQHMKRCTLGYTMAGWRCATPFRGSRCGCRRRPELKAGTPVKADAPSADFPPCAGRPQAARAATA